MNIDISLNQPLNNAILVFTAINKLIINLEQY